MRNLPDILERLKEHRFIVMGSGVDGLAAQRIDYQADGGNIDTRLIFSFGKGWEHASVSHTNENPTWDEMCEIQDIFWNDSETCVQYHPAKSNYVNDHEHCLHIWKPIGRITLPTPPSILVGYKKKD